MKQAKRLIAAALIAAIGAVQIGAQTLKIHYLPDGMEADAKTLVDRTGNGHDAQLNGSAAVSTRTVKGVTDSIIKMGAFKGYIDMGEKAGNTLSQLKDFTISISFYAPGTLNRLTDEGNYLWSFSNNEDASSFENGYMGLSARKTTYQISKSGNAAQESVQSGNAPATSVWTTVVMVQQGTHVRLYENGAMVANGELETTPAQLGATRYNRIGFPLQASQSYLKYVDVREFRLYDGALNSRQVAELCGAEYSEEAATLKLHHTFESLAGSSATLQGGATLSTEGGEPILSLGDEGGYLDLGEEAGKVAGSLQNFSIATYLCLPTAGNLGQNGNFIYTFANSDNMASDANGCLFLGANQMRYAITPTHYSDEQAVSLGSAFAVGEWKHVAYTQRDGVGTLYINGEPVKSGKIELTPSQLGNTTCNYLGRSCYKGDSYLKGAKYCDFRIYEGALADYRVYELASAKLNALNSDLYNRQLSEAAAALELAGCDHLNQDLTLPVSAPNGIAISWSSSNEKLITPEGKITRPQQGKADGKATLTATLSKKGSSIAKEFEVTVLARLDAKGSVAYDLAQIELQGNLNSLYSDLALPTVTLEGSILSWKSSDTAYLSDNGKLNRLAATGEQKSVTLTVTAYKEGVTESRDFVVTIGQDEGYCAYLFAYFTGNNPADEQICFALSMDGYNYIPLNEGEPIISSDTISLKKGVRDPHILRGEDGKTFYMVVTDMRSNQGWSSNDGMVLMKSSDLINWSHATIDFPDTWPQRFDRDDLTQVWAPQTIYDPAVGKYMVYYSIGMKSQPHYVIYYSYANDDFTELTEPQVLFDLGSNTIDADIVYSNGLYHMFYKTEGEGNGIQKATAPSLQGPWTPYRTYLQQTSVAVEGSGVFKLINSGDWVLMYDCYTSGHYQFCSSSDLEHFTFVRNTATSGKFTPRHGTVMPISSDEAQRLIAKWPSSALSNAPLGSNSLYTREDQMEISAADKSIYLPVRYGADLKNFDPMLYGYAGTTVSPAGAQDFTAGPVEYTFSMPGKSDVTYQVSARLAVNPILPSFHADPEILYSHKTGKFYCYTTTDGVSGWGGTYFQCYSSPNLVEWTLESTVVDLATAQVSWANGNAWAPAIDEKKIDGEYRYFFYFSGNAGSNKQIGVATSNTPVGPFTDHGTSIIATSPTGGGQQIDVDVFTDPTDNKSYIYWGNGYMAGAELMEDMATLKEGTTKVLTPQGGTLQSYAYREAPYVFYRNGLYYFLWSVDDTGSPNYHVAYGTSTSPLGPITVAKEPIVIIQDAEHKIYGTAHNSILQIPGRDEWYIVYHRINKNYLNNGPGIHRETCIDRLYFNEDGTIQRVTPTHEGVQPVDVSDVITLVEQGALIGSDAQVVDTTYYSLSGVYLGKTLKSVQSGIYIKRDLLADGMVSTSKLYKD